MARLRPRNQRRYPQQGSQHHSHPLGWEGRFPMEDRVDTWTFTDNLTKICNRHQFKAGVQYEHVHYLFDHSGPSEVFPGRFDFSHSTANTVTNTTYPYANALLGYYNA